MSNPTSEPQFTLLIAASQATAYRIAAVLEASRRLRIIATQAPGQALALAQVKAPRAALVEVSAMGSDPRAFLEHLMPIARERGFPVGVLIEPDQELSTETAAALGIEAVFSKASDGDGLPYPEIGAFVDSYHAPVPEKAAHPSRYSQRHSAGPNPTLPSGAALKILIVDDNPLNLHVTQATLRTMGCHADIESDSAAAIDTIQREAYDIVLVDLRMPQPDGFETARQIRRNERERQPNHPATAAPLILVAVTASEDPGDLARSREAGMDRYLTKPIQYEALKQIVEAGLQRQENRMDLAPVPQESPSPNAGVQIPDDSDAPDWLDEEHLKFLFAAGREEAQDILRTFLHEWPIQRRTLEQCLADQDFGSFANQAHRMAGSCAAAGATRLAQAYRELEHTARGNEPERSLARLPSLKIIEFRTQAMLAERLNSSAPSPLG